jgi:hypothetical protein
MVNLVELVDDPRVIMVPAAVPVAHPVVQSATSSLFVVDLIAGITNSTLVVKEAALADVFTVKLLVLDALA